MEKKKSNDLKSFFVKLISISFAVILVINILYNMFLSDKIETIQKIFSLTELENRKDFGDEIRNNLNSLLKKEILIKKEDKVLLFKLYKKIKTEFKDIN
mgnify:CR=1 FL=1|jgi:hypothetical protein|tara:strand:+ start:86 stop:382 length:297 start_codon:yes stop_codon:yes gene_type:complete